MNAQPLQCVIVVFAELRFGLCVGSLGINGRYPIFRFRLRLERWCIVKSCNRINPAHERRSRNDLQVLARTQRYDLFLSNELLDAFQVSFNGQLQVVALCVIVGNFGQHLADD